MSNCLYFEQGATSRNELKIFKKLANIRENYTILIFIKTQKHQ